MLSRWIPNFGPVFQNRSDMCQIKTFTGIFHIIASVVDQIQNTVRFANRFINMHFLIQATSDHATEIVLTIATEGK